MGSLFETMNTRTSSVLSLAVTHLNASVGPVLTVAQLTAALRAGAVDAIADAPTAAALVTSLFVETEPRLGYSGGS